MKDDNVSHSFTISSEFHIFSEVATGERKVRRTKLNCGPGETTVLSIVQDEGLNTADEHMRAVCVEILRRTRK